MENVVDKVEQRHTAEGLKSRHHKWHFYLRGIDALVSALHELCSRHLKSKHQTKNAVRMIDIHAGIKKTKAFKHIMGTKIKPHMEKCRKYINDKSFSILGYGISMFTKKRAEIQRDMWSNEQITH